MIHVVSSYWGSVYVSLDLAKHPRLLSFRAGLLARTKLLFHVGCLRKPPNVVLMPAKFRMHKKFETRALQVH